MCFSSEPRVCLLFSRSCFMLFANRYPIEHFFFFIFCIRELGNFQGHINVKAKRAFRWATKKNYANIALFWLFLCASYEREFLRQTNCTCNVDFHLFWTQHVDDGFIVDGFNNYTHTYIHCIRCACELQVCIYLSVIPVYVYVQLRGVIWQQRE